MTIPATDRKAGPFFGDGVTTVLPFTFKVFTTADVQVVQADADGNTVALTPGTDYAVTLNVDQTATPGGAVTLTTAPATGYRTGLLGAIPYNQTIRVPSSGSFKPELHENAFDRTVMQIQQLAEQMGRALLANPVSGANLAFPAPSSGRFIRWRSDLLGFENAEASDNPGLQGILNAGTGSLQIGHLAAGAGAVSVPLQTVLRRKLDPADYLNGGDQTAAMQAAINSVGDDRVIELSDDNNNWTSTINLGGLGKGARVGANGGRKVKMNVAAGQDGIVLQGYAMRPVALIGVDVDMQGTGQDGVSLRGSAYPEISATVRNTMRDGFALVTSGTDFIQSGEMNLTTQDTGRDGIRCTMTGANGTFQNEIVVLISQIRGVSKKQNGGRAITFVSTASDAASKFGNPHFVHTIFDAQYNVGDPFKPSLVPVQLDAGLLENLKMDTGSWENTGSGDISGGYAVYRNGGTWNGYPELGVVNNSGWGSAGVDPNILQRRVFDISRNQNILSGYMINPEGFFFDAFLTASATAQTGDGVLRGLGPWSVISDLRTNFAASTGGIVFPVAGRYLIELTVQVNGMANTHTFGQIYRQVSSGPSAGTRPVGATTAPYLTRDASGNSFLAASTILQASAGATGGMYGVVGGGAQTVSVIGGSANATRITGHLLG